MKRRLSCRNSSGSGRIQSLLLHRLESCKHYQSVDDVVKYLHSRYPEYKRVGTSILTRSVNRALSESKQEGKQKRCKVDSQIPSSPSATSASSFEWNSASDSTGGHVSNPKHDLMKSMLREGYCHAGVLGCDEASDESGRKDEEKKKNVLEVLSEEEKSDGINVSKLPEKTQNKDLDRGLGSSRSLPMFGDFGGMDKVIEELIYRVLIPLRYQELRSRLKIMRAELPTGILLHGPPGCGKTKLAQAIANESGLPFYEIAAPQIVSGVSGQSEENIRELFAKARKTSPSIIFIDEIDAISEKRENSQKGMEGRIVTQLLKCMDNMQECTSPVSLEGVDSRVQPCTSKGKIVSETKPGHVLVIGATNRPNSLDRALRRPGRFSWEIELHAPDENARFEILSLLTRDLGARDSLDLRKLAKCTNGFVGADLEDCVSKACLLAMQKLIDLKRFEAAKKTIPFHVIDDWWKRLSFTLIELESLVPTMADFEEAVKSVQPSLKREGFSMVPDVKWEDVGGLDNIRQRFKRTIVRPIKCSKDNEGSRANLPAGFLLYGPPGCGKTLIASAVANEAGASFIYIKGPELLKKYVGESELAVRELFGRARTCSPCILFFDEVDSLTASCGESSGVTDRVLKQLLIELDGVEERRGVYVVGATNRPELIDRALLRPGRFEELLYVPLPSPDERGLILKALARKAHIDAIDAKVDLLAIGKSKACDHFSGADLYYLMRRANELAYQEMESLDHSSLDTIPVTLNICHFEKALVGMTPSVNKEQREFYDCLSQRFSAA